jgi:hypothetical protein
VCGISRMSTNGQPETTDGHGTAQNSGKIDQHGLPDGYPSYVYEYMWEGQLAREIGKRENQIKKLKGELEELRAMCAGRISDVEAAKLIVQYVETKKPEPYNSDELENRWIVEEKPRCGCTIM